MAGTGSSLDFGPQTIAGGYNVIGTNTTTGCSRTMSGSASISVNPVPAVFAITGGGSYCAGGYGLHIGLAGSTSGISYQLYRGTIMVGSAMSGTGAALDFGLQAAVGTYTVLATNTFTSCTSTMSGTAAIAILTVPSAGTISGPTTVATGATITLSETVSGGTWSTPAFGHVTVGATTGIVTGISAGASTVSYTVTNTCGSAYATYAVTETGPAHRGFTAGTTEICVGTSAAIPFTKGGGIWTSSDEKVATVDIQYGIVTAHATGIAEIIYSETDISGSTTTTVTPLIVNPVLDELNINAKPGTSIAPGEHLSLSATIANGSPVYEFQWLLNNVVIPGANAGTYTGNGFADNDILTCKATGACGNIVLSKSVKITVVSNAVHPVAETSGLRVLPNPNNGLFTIKGNLGNSIDDLVTIEISDVLGQVVYNGKATAKAGELNETIQLANNIANGMYLINLHSGNGSHVLHVVITQ